MSAPPCPSLSTGTRVTASHHSCHAASLVTAAIRQISPCCNDQNKPRQDRRSLHTMSHAGQAHTHKHAMCNPQPAQPAHPAKATTKVPIRTLPSNSFTPFNKAQVPSQASSRHVDAVAIAIIGQQPHQQQQQQQRKQLHPMDYSKSGRTSHIFSRHRQGRANLQRAVRTEWLSHNGDSWPVHASPSSNLSTPEQDRDCRCQRGWHQYMPDMA